MQLTQRAARHDLAESVAPYLRVGELLDLSGSDELGDLKLGYGTAAGNPQLRRLVAEQHEVAADDVVITTGGIHALFLIAFILCERGDQALTTSALFPLARSALDAVGASVQTLSVSFDNRYRLDLDEVHRMLSAETKLVSLASPQNPSGVAIPRETISAVATMMSQQCPDAFLLIDETYRDGAYSPTPMAQSAVGLGPNVVVCASLSKNHGAPGLRVGWAITQNNALRDQILHGKYATTISGSTIDEALALRILDDPDIVTLRRRHFAEGLLRTQRWASEHAHLVDWIQPDGGALSCVRLKPSVFTAEAVGSFFAALDKLDCRVASGTWFGDQDRVFRLGFGYLSLAELEVALAALSVALAESVPSG